MLSALFHLNKSVSFFEGLSMADAKMQSSFASLEWKRLIWLSNFGFNDVLPFSVPSLPLQMAHDLFLQYCDSWHLVFTSVNINFLFDRDIQKHFK